MIPERIALKKSDYDELLSILQWQKSMPSPLNNIVGERFRENLWYCIRDYIPVDLEDWEYVNHVELLVDGTIDVVFGTDGHETTLITRKLAVDL